MASPFNSLLGVNTNFNPTNLVNTLNQGKISTESGVLPPVSGNTGNFVQVTTEYIKTHLIPNYKVTENTDTASYGLARKPWIFTTYEALQSLQPQANQLAKEARNLSNASKNYDTLNNLKVKDADAKRIFLAVNPSSVSWQIPQRGAEAKNKSGTVNHYWYDPIRGTYFDDPKITISFQTGSIMPLPTSTVKQYNSNTEKEEVVPVGHRMPPSLYNFYQFLSLVDQQKITSSGEANLIHILYRSNVFPSLVLTGLFDPQVVVQFQDDSQSPWKITGWTSTFTVYSTTPKLNNYSELVDMFKSEFTNVK